MRPSKVMKMKRRSQVEDVEARETQNSTQEEEITLVDYHDNHIYFYDEITHQTVMFLVQFIRILDQQNRVMQIEWDLPAPPPIHIHINSYGGSYHAGMAAYRAVKNATSPIHIHNEGGVASAATFMAVAGDHRTMGRESLFCIHEIINLFYGKYHEFQDEMKNLDTEMGIMYDVYMKHSKLTKEDLDEIMKGDMWLTAQEALEKGLIDEILG